MGVLAMLVVVGMMRPPPAGLAGSDEEEPGTAAEIVPPAAAQGSTGNFDQARHSAASSSVARYSGVGWKVGISQAIASRGPIFWPPVGGR